MVDNSSGLLERSLTGSKVGEYAILGELSMDGSVRPIKGALPIAVGVRDSDIQGLILPHDS